MKRLVSSIGLWTLVGLAIFVWPAWVSALLWAAFLSLAFTEFCQLVKAKSSFVMYPSGLVGGLLLLAGIWQMFQNLQAALLLPFVLVVVLLAMFVAYMSSRRPVDRSIERIALSYLGFLFIFGLGGFWLAIRLLPAGQWWLFWALAVVKMGDVGGLLVGRNFGKHRIMPVISPQKTWEGSVASVLFSVLTGVLLNEFLVQEQGVVLLQGFELVLVPVALNLLGQVGDASESLLKRDYAQKDAGGVIPGIGGVFDLLDSLLWAGPLLFMYIVVRMFV